LKCTYTIAVPSPEIVNSTVAFATIFFSIFGDHIIHKNHHLASSFHLILIPLEDQHVHRFLFKEMKKEREPDTYVKTILTFGDKPAPAMVQTALRKTAEEGES